MVRGHYHKVGDKKNKNSLKEKFDKFVFVVTAFGILMTLPQLINIWVSHNVSGVSIVPWFAYTLMSGFWIGYGKIHDDQRIVVANILFGIVDLLILLGIIIYS